MIEGFVLAGGRSRRMGVDKARLAGPCGWTLAVCVATVLREVADRVRVVRRGADGVFPTPWGVDLEVVGESDEGDVHPLWGVASACAAARSPHLLIAPCDVPYLRAEDVVRLVAAMPIGGGVGPATALADASGAVIATSVDGDHPLIAVLPRALGPAAAAAAGRSMSARDFFSAAVRVALPAQSVVNINAPGDLGGRNSVAAVAERTGRSEVAVAAERARLAARGCLVPDPLRRG